MKQCQWLQFDSDFLHILLLVTSSHCAAIHLSRLLILATKFHKPTDHYGSRRVSGSREKCRYPVYVTQCCPPHKYFTGSEAASANICRHLHRLAVRLPPAYAMWIAHLCQGGTMDGTDREGRGCFWGGAGRETKLGKEGVGSAALVGGRILSPFPLTYFPWFCTSKTAAKPQGKGEALQLSPWCAGLGRGDFNRAFLHW